MLMEVRQGHAAAESCWQWCVEEGVHVLLWGHILSYTELSLVIVYTLTLLSIVRTVMHCITPYHCASLKYVLCCAVQFKALSYNVHYY